MSAAGEDSNIIRLMKAGLYPKCARSKTEDANKEYVLTQLLSESITEVASENISLLIAKPNSKYVCHSPTRTEVYGIYYNISGVKGLSSQIKTTLVYC